MSYSKLHSSIVNSSLWTERDSVRILFVTLLAMCDRDGIVYGTRTGLSRAANIEPDDIDEAWGALFSTDNESSDKMRAPEHEGRRIEEVSGGFRLLNFDYYRGLRNDDERREQNRQAQARFKSKVSHGKPESATVSHGKPPKAQAEAEAEAEAEADFQPPTPPKAQRDAAFDEFWSAYPRKIGKGNAETAWKKHKCSTILPQILVTIRACKISKDWTKDGGQFIPHPATWLNRKGWEDEPALRSNTRPGEYPENFDHLVPDSEK